MAVAWLPVHTWPKKGYTTPIKWGRDHEAVARTAYVHHYSAQHEDFSVKESGLIISAEHPYLAASPDGIVTCSCHEQGIKEIKCPYSYREGTIEDMRSSSDCYLGENLMLKRDHQYYAQTNTSYLSVSLNFVTSWSGCLVDIMCSVYILTRNIWPLLCES